jgi:hypothetical protein
MITIVNIVFFILFLVALALLWDIPSCPQCGRLGADLVHEKKLWVGNQRKQLRPMRPIPFEGNPFFVAHLMDVIYERTFRCRNEGCLHVWNKIEEVVEEQVQLDNQQPHHRTEGRSYGRKE